MPAQCSQAYVHRSPTKRQRRDRTIGQAHSPQHYITAGISKASDIVERSPPLDRRRFGAQHTLRVAVPVYTEWGMPESVTDDEQKALATEPCIANEPRPTITHQVRAPKLPLIICDTEPTLFISSEKMPAASATESSEAQDVPCMSPLDLVSPGSAWLHMAQNYCSPSTVSSLRSALRAQTPR